MTVNIIDYRVATLSFNKSMPYFFNQTSRHVTAGYEEHYKIFEALSEPNLLVYVINK